MKKFWSTDEVTSEDISRFQQTLLDDKDDGWREAYRLCDDALYGDEKALARVTLMIWNHGVRE